MQLPSWCDWLKHVQPSCWLACCRRSAGCRRTTSHVLCPCGQAASSQCSGELHGAHVHWPARALEGHSIHGGGGGRYPGEGRAGGGLGGLQRVLAAPLLGAQLPLQLALPLRLRLPPLLLRPPHALLALLRLPARRGGGGACCGCLPRGACCLLGNTAMPLPRDLMPASNARLVPAREPLAWVG
jgi:hypothetical protein